MPFDQNDVGVQRRIKKQQQQGQAQGQAANPVGSTPSNYDTAYNPVTTVDSSARGTLSTANVLYLSGMTSEDKELARLGRLFAKNFAVPPWFVFGTHDPKKYISPITGQPLSVKDARLFSNDFGAVPLASMLKSSLSYTEGAGYKSARGQTTVNKVTLDPTKVGKFARAIADTLPDLNMSDALGASIHATKLGYNPAMFANNLGVVSQWYASTGTKPDEKQLLFYTNLITSQGKKLNSVNDVVAALYGKGVKGATKQAQAQASGANSPYQNTSGVGLAIPGQGPTIQEQNYRNLQDAAIKGGQPVPLMRGETFTPTDVTDYWTQVQAEANQVAIDEAASQNSFFNRFVMVPIGHVMNAANAVYDKGFGGAVYLMRVPVAGATAGLAAVGLDKQGDSAEQNWQHVMAAGRYQFSRLWGQQETPGSLIAEPLGDKYKHWVGPGLDLMIQWAMDPTVLAGEARASYLDKFVLPATLDHTNALRSAVEWLGEKAPLADRFVTPEASVEDQAVKLWSNRVAKFAQSKISRRIFEAAGDDTKANRIIYRLRGKVEARGTLDMQYMTALRDKILEKYPNLGDQAWQEWQDGVKAHFLGVAPEGSVAADVVNARLNEGFRTEKIVADSKPVTPNKWQGHSYVDQGGLLVPETVPQALANDVLGFHDSGAFPGWLRQEVPGTSPLSEWGPRRIVRSAVTSPRFTETAIGKRVAALPNMNPGRLLDFNDAPEQYVYEHAVRWSTFSETQAQEYSSQIADIVNSGRMVETRIGDVVHQMNSDAVTQILGKYNISDEEKAKLSADLLEPPASAAPLTQQAFGALDGEGIYQPITEAQLRNQMYVVDPVVVRQGIRDYVSMRDRMYSALTRAIHVHAPEVGTSTLLNFGHGAVVGASNTLGDVYRAWLRMWKAAAVARPGYVSRVVLGDENARFLATTSSLGDRLLSISFGHRAAEDSNFAKSFLDSTFGETLKVGDQTIDIRRAGAFEYEAAAAGKVREADIINELEHGKQFLQPVMKADGSWDVIPPTDPNHMADWTYGLTHHIRGTGPGDVALASVAAGDTVEQTAVKLAQWAKEDKFYTLAGRIGVKPADVGDWADQLSKVVHAYTMDDAQVAKVVVEGDRQKIADVLNVKYPKIEDRPDVHGPTMAALTDGGADPRLLNRFVNWNYTNWVRRPEDALNRQPFFAEWKKRSMTAMYKAIGTDPERLQQQVDLFRVPGRVGTTEADLLGHEAPQVLRPTVGDGEGWVYHVSPPENFDSIRASGLKPTVTHDVPADWVDPTMREPRLFFADSLDRAQALSWKAGDQVAFRVKAATVGDSMPERLFSGSQSVRDTIHPDNIEFLGADNKWHNLTEEGGKFLSPRIQQVVDRASTDFALGQVKRVMFDFTKQSRFTELLQFAFPFPQPFFEGFQAWGHIAYRNPTAIAHARLLFQAGINSGFFKKDPVSGEYMVSAGIFRQPAIWTAIALGGDKNLMKHMDSPWMPLSNLNLLTAASVKFGGNGITGKLIGGVPIPVPSMNPLLSAAMMKVFANTRSPALQGYLFQYGADPQFLPTSLQAVAKTVFPGWYADDASKQSTALAVTEALHRYGLDTMDLNGKTVPIPLSDAEIPAWEAKYGTKFSGQTLDQIAADQTNAMWEMRPWVSMLMPTAARLAFEGQRADYAAWEQMIHDNGDDYQKAYSQWIKENPDKFMIPAGKTWTGPGEGDGTGVRVPASELTYQMLRTPGIGDFMTNYKPWAALLLVGTDPSIQEQQNFAAFSDLMAKGFVSYKTPSEYYQSGADNAGWAKYDTFSQSIYYPAFDKGVKQYGSITAFEQSDAYNKLKATRQQFFDSLYRTDPHWVLSNLKPQYAPDGTTVWDWPQDFGGSTPTQVARAHATDIVNMPELQSFPGVQALKQYMDGTDSLIQKMQNKRVTDITSDQAREAGLWGQYKSITQKTLAEQPDVAPFLEKYFGVQLDDNGKVTGTNDLIYNMSGRAWAFQDVLDNLQKKGMTPEAAKQILDNVVQLDTHLARLKREAGTAPINSYQRSLDYKKVDDLINTTWKQAPQVLRQWWNAQGTSYQQDYKQYMATKPPEFYTAFDYHVAGISLTKRAQTWMQWIADKRIEMDKHKQNDPTYTLSTGYDQINAYVKQHAGKDKTFDQAVTTINTPGWGVDHVLGYGVDTRGQVVSTQGTSLNRNLYDSKGDYLWAQFLRVTRQVTDALQSGGYSGVNYGTDAERKAYRSVQDQVGRIAQHYKNEDPQFKQMWDDLQKQYGDTLMQNLFIPDDLFPPIGATHG